MPFGLRKVPRKPLYWVVNKETGKKYSKEGLPKERAEAQRRALYASEKRGGMDSDLGERLVDLPTLTSSEQEYLYSIMKYKVKDKQITRSNLDDVKNGLQRALIGAMDEKNMKQSLFYVKDGKNISITDPAKVRQYYAKQIEKTSALVSTITDFLDVVVGDKNMTVDFSSKKMELTGGAENQDEYVNEIRDELMTQTQNAYNWEDMLTITDEVGNVFRLTVEQSSTLDGIVEMITANIDDISEARDAFLTFLSQPFQLIHPYENPQDDYENPQEQEGSVQGDLENPENTGGMDRVDTINKSGYVSAAEELIIAMSGLPKDYKDDLRRVHIRKSQQMGIVSSKEISDLRTVIAKLKYATKKEDANKILREYSGETFVAAPSIPKRKETESTEESLKVVANPLQRIGKGSARAKVLQEEAIEATTFSELKAVLDDVKDVLILTEKQKTKFDLLYRSIKQIIDFGGQESSPMVTRFRDSLIKFFDDEFQDNLTGGRIIFTDQTDAIKAKHNFTVPEVENIKTVYKNEFDGAPPSSVIFNPRYAEYLLLKDFSQRIHRHPTEYKGHELSITKVTQQLLGLESAIGSPDVQQTSSTSADPLVFKVKGIATDTPEDRAKIGPLFTRLWNTYKDTSANKALRVISGSLAKDLTKIVNIQNIPEIASGRANPKREDLQKLYEEALVAIIPRPIVGGSMDSDEEYFEEEDEMDGSGKSFGGLREVFYDVFGSRLKF